MTKLNLYRKVGRVLLSGFFCVLLALSALANRALWGDVYPYASADRVVGPETLERSQGVTTDGSAWFFSGKQSLTKIAFDNKTVLAQNRNAIPDAFRSQYGSTHIGGISFADGCVWAAIEDSKVWRHPIVAVFDGETLEYTGRYVLLHGKDSGSDTALTRGVPWVTCDPDSGCFYVAQCRHTTQLYAYDLDTFDYVRTIPLQGEIDRIQGGEVYAGVFYAATNDATRAVYKIDLACGKIDKLFDRILYQPKRIDNFGGEGEDMTVLPMADGTLLHTLTIGALFVDANLCHYQLPD